MADTSLKEKCQMALVVDQVCKSFGALKALDRVSIRIEQGSLVCFLGPSGCGKTTLLRVIAGLERFDSGTLALNQQDLSLTPARKRNFGVVFQSYSLFPNMTIAGNVGYGLMCRKWDRQRIKARVADMLALVQLTDQSDKYPHQLSGGQQQRIALARALAPEPELLLLDEPLSALDAKVREELRIEIRGIQQQLGITTIMVTHDQEEALTMADTIVVMNQGQVMQCGSPMSLYRAPENRFVAEFIGRMNIIPADHRFPWSTIIQRTSAAPKLLGIRPEDITFRPYNEDKGLLPALVDQVTCLGNLTRVAIRLKTPEGKDIKLISEIQGTDDNLCVGMLRSIRVAPEAVRVLEWH